MQPINYLLAFSFAASEFLVGFNGLSSTGISIDCLWSLLFQKVRLPEEVKCRHKCGRYTDGIYQGLRCHKSPPQLNTKQRRSPTFGINRRFRRYKFFGLQYFAPNLLAPTNGYFPSAKVLLVPKFPPFLETNTDGYMLCSGGFPPSINFIFCLLQRMVIYLAVYLLYQWICFLL